MKSVSFAVANANAKGGVGKTRTAVNVAAMAAALPKEDGSVRRVLVCDLDAQMNATQQLGFSDIDPEQTLARYIREDANLDEIIIKNAAAVPGLDLLPAHYQMAYEEQNNTEVLRYGTWLRQRLRPFRARYDLIIFDCPVNLGELTSNALGASNGVLIPTQAEKHSVLGLPHLIARAGRVFTSTEVPNPWAVILITMYDKRNSVERNWASYLRESHADRTLNTIVRRNTALAKSASGGLPIVAFDEKAAGFEDYLAVTKELLSTLDTYTPALSVVSNQAVSA